MSLHHLPKCCPKLQVFESALQSWQATAKADSFQIITQQKWLSLNAVRAPFHCHLPGDISGGMKRRSADLSQSTTVRSCLLHQREKAVPCQFMNIELPGCIWFPEYNFVAIFTCLKKYTQVLDLGPPNPGLASPSPPENFGGLRDVSRISRSQKEEAHHGSHHGAGLTPCQSIPPYTKGFGSPSTPCLRISPHPAPCGNGALPLELSGSHRRFKSHRSATPSWSFWECRAISRHWIYRSWFLFFMVKQHICISICVYIYIYMCMCIYIYLANTAIDCFWDLIWRGEHCLLKTLYSSRKEEGDSWSFYILYTSSCNLSLASWSPRSIHNVLQHSTTSRVSSTTINSCLFWAPIKAIPWPKFFF